MGVLDETIALYKRRYKYELAASVNNLTMKNIVPPGQDPLPVVVERIQKKVLGLLFLQALNANMPDDLGSMQISVTLYGNNIQEKLDGCHTENTGKGTAFLHAMRIATKSVDVLVDLGSGHKTAIKTENRTETIAHSALLMLLEPDKSVADSNPILEVLKHLSIEQQLKQQYKLTLGSDDAYIESIGCDTKTDPNFCVKVYTELRKLLQVFEIKAVEQTGWDATHHLYGLGPSDTAQIIEGLKLIVPKLDDYIMANANRIEEVLESDDRTSSPTWTWEQVPTIYELQRGLQPKPTEDAGDTAKDTGALTATPVSSLK